MAEGKREEKTRGMAGTGDKELPEDGKEKTAPEKCGHKSFEESSPSQRLECTDGPV